MMSHTTRILVGIALVLATALSAAQDKRLEFNIPPQSLSVAPGNPGQAGV